MCTVKIWRPKLIVGTLMFTFSACVMAIGNFKPTSAELAVLPAFCAPRAQPYGNDSNHPEVKVWFGIYGQDWIHMHHYCEGLNHINQSYRSANRREKERILAAAIGEFDYTIRNVRPNTKLIADILMARGQALIGLGRIPESISDLQKAVAIDPTLRRAYGLLADGYVTANQSENALKVVSEGIRHNPGSTSLMRRYDELGGAKPYPPPYIPETPTEKPLVDPSDASREQAEPSHNEKADVNSEMPSNVPHKPESSEAPPEIGSPTNPWCRFCPQDPP